jgi:putative transposon-encoded protein
MLAYSFMVTLFSKAYMLSICNFRMLVERITYEGPVRKRVTKFSHGGHIIVPGHWVGKEVRVTIIDDNDSQQTKSKVKEKEEPPITTREELRNEYSKFKHHTSAAARLARRNIKYSPDSREND